MAEAKPGMQRRTSGSGIQRSTQSSVAIMLIIILVLPAAAVEFFQPSAAGFNGTQVQTTLFAIEDDGLTTMANRWTEVGPIVHAAPLVPIFEDVQNITLGTDYAGVKTNYGGDTLQGGEPTEVWAAVPISRSRLVEADITSVIFTINTTDQVFTNAKVDLFYRVCTDSDFIGCMTDNVASYFIDTQVVTLAPVEIFLDWDSSDDLGINSLDMTGGRIGFLVVRYTDEIIVEDSDVFMDLQIQANEDPAVSGDTLTALAFIGIGVIVLYMGLLLHEKIQRGTISRFLFSGGDGDSPSGGG